MKLSFELGHGLSCLLRAGRLLRRNRLEVRVVAAQVYVDEVGEAYARRRVRRVVRRHAHDRMRAALDEAKVLEAADWHVKVLVALGQRDALNAVGGVAVALVRDVGRVGRGRAKGVHRPEEPTLHALEQLGVVLLFPPLVGNVEAAESRLRARRRRRR